jgi:signal transduction histidine kinase
VADEQVMLTFPDAPRGELDRRLADLVAAAHDVLATQGRLRALLRANQAVVAQLELPSVLRRIVAAATELAGVKYGGLGVLSPDGELEDFLQVGMTEEDLLAIGGPPHGVGLLAALVDEAHPIRLGRVTDDPRFGGLPPGHPAIRSFLGVPIRARGRIYGNLYLGDPAEDAFTEEDEQLVSALASTAGFAIENARLFSETQHRQAWASASAEITAQLLQAGGSEGALSLIATRILALAEADSAYVALLNDALDRMTFIEAQGEDPVSAKGLELPVEGTLTERVLRDGRPARFTEHELKSQRVTFADRFGPMMAIPLATPSRTLGVLLVNRGPGGRSFTEAELELAADFAGRASVALELGIARSDQERMLLFEERGRIARELHDRVIQQLFGTGLQLQNVLATLPPGRSQTQVDAAIAGVDETIAQIRRIVFTLSSSSLPGPSTGRRRLLDLIVRLGSALSIEPTLVFQGPVDGVVDDGLAEEVLAVVSEAVTNAVKHAGAKTVTITVSADVRGVTVTVVNDGRPFTRSRRRSGLANLEERARRRGGTMTIGTDDAGTTLVWQVPVGGLDAAAELAPGA